MNSNIDIGDKLKSRLLKFYKCIPLIRDEYSGKMVECTFDLRDVRENLPELNMKLIDLLCISKHDQITEFIKNGLENDFSAQDISEFIISNRSMFPDETGVEIDGKKRDFRYFGSKSLRVMKFLLLILDISQDKNFRSPKQELTIDYILELAKNITDYKLRCQFKMAAVSYFLPDDNEYIKSHLSSVMSDMKKLFAQELSGDNNEIEMEYKFEIKYRILNMLTAKRNLIRKDIADFDMGEDSNFMRTFDPWTSPVKIVENNETKTYTNVRYRPYTYYHDCLSDDVLRRQNNLRDGNFEDQSAQESFVIANDLNEIDNTPNFIEDDIKNFKNPDGEINFVDDDADDIKKLLLIWSDDDCPQEKQSAVLNNILDFAVDYIKKLVDNKSKPFDWFTVFLFSDVRNLFSDEVLLKKIDELLAENEHNQNDYKIFTLVLVLLQNNNDGLHLLDVFSIAKQFANKTVLQKKLDTKMKFKLLNFVRKFRRDAINDIFDGYYEKLYRVLFSDGDIRWKIENRLLKFYKDKFPEKNKFSNCLVDLLFDNRYDPSDQEIVNALCIGKHDQITEFIKNGLENNFSTQAISEFIIDNESMFFNGIGQVYSVEINEQELEVKFVGSKSSRVMRFLLLILDISQDENFRNPKQELTIDYILDLAENIDDHKDRYKFKILALSYFLPRTNAWVDDGKICKINFSQYIADIKKLFADELSTENKKINEKDKLEIKRVAIDILTVNRDFVRKDASDSNLDDDSYLEKYCSCSKDGTKNFSYYHIDKDKDSVLKMKLNAIDGILDFFEDDIKKSINDKDANNNFFKSNGLLFSNIRSLSSDKDLLQKINELIEKNQNGQNDHKIFVLIFALIQDSNSPDFCIDKLISREAETVDNPYGLHVHDDILKYLSGNLSPEMKLKLLFFFYEQLMYVYKNSGKDEIYTDDLYFSEKSKLVNIFYPNFEKYICDFCALCKKDKFSKIAFGSLAWNIFVNNHNNAYDKHKVLGDMLKCVSDKILEGNKDVNPFLYEFLDNMSDRYVGLAKQNNDFSYESTIIFACFILLIEKDKNMSDDAKNKINDFIITLFSPDNLLHNLKNDPKNLAFIHDLTLIIKNKKFDFDLPSQNKSFFAYIKEGLKSVRNDDNSRNILAQYKNKKNEKVSLESQISNLKSRVDYYKKFYWFNLIPVFGWIGCVVFYFSKLRSMENKLNMLQGRLRSAESVPESWCCDIIEDFINSGDDYNKNKQNSISEIVEGKKEKILSDNISNNQPQLDKQESVK